MSKVRRSHLLSLIDLPQRRQSEELRVASLTSESRLCFAFVDVETLAARKADGPNARPPGAASFVLSRSSVDFIGDIFEILLRGWKRGSRAQKWAVVIVVAASAVAVLTFLVNQVFVHAPEESAKYVYGGLAGVAAIAYLFLKTAVDVEAKLEIRERVKRAEVAVAEHPRESRPLWDLARARLELYFERNLSQIKTIFWITVAVMIAGFVMIFYGIFRAFDSQNIQPSIVAAASGIVTEFIGATFLVIYRSTMAQASEYVATLERINAVGMSIQIADSIEDTESKLKSQLRAELATRILDSSSSKIDFRRVRPIKSTAGSKRGNQGTNGPE
jgi:hypothetical protein